MERIFNKRKLDIDNISDEINKNERKIRTMEMYLSNLIKHMQICIDKYIETYKESYIFSEDDYKKTIHCLRVFYNNLINGGIENNLRDSKKHFDDTINELPTPILKTIAIMHPEKHSIRQHYSWLEDRIKAMYGLQNDGKYGMNSYVIPILCPTNDKNEGLIPNSLYRPMKNKDYVETDKLKDSIGYYGLSLDDSIDLFEIHKEKIPTIFKVNNDIFYEHYEKNIFEGIHETELFKNINVHSCFDYLYLNKSEIDISGIRKQRRIPNQFTNEWTALSVCKSRNTGYRCLCCGQISIYKDSHSNKQKTKTLDAHEMWCQSLDVDTKIFKKTLKRIVPLCNVCHRVFHGNWSHKSKKYTYIKNIIKGPQIIPNVDINEKECCFHIDVSIITNEDILKNSKFINLFKNNIIIPNNTLKTKKDEDIIDDFMPPSF